MASIEFANDNYGGTPYTDFTTHYWFQSVSSYLSPLINLSGVWRCPANNNQTTLSALAQQQKKNQAKWAWVDIDYVTYDYVVMNPATGAVRITNGNPANATPLRLQAINHPSRAPWISDCEQAGIGTAGIWSPQDFSTGVISPGTLKWHLTGLNVAFWDGHVEYIIDPVCGYDSTSGVMTLASSSQRSLLLQPQP